MKKLTLEDLEDLVVGSAILGSGGGGDPSYTYMMARYEMEKRGFVNLASYSDLRKEDVVLPIGLIGAPLADIEKLLNGKEFFHLFELIEKYIGKKVDVIMPFEIGGGNAFTPLMVAAQLGLPLLDADMMGRAYPEGQMTSCHLVGLTPSPSFIIDSLMNAVIINANDSYTLEKIARQITIAMGSIAAFGHFPLAGGQAEMSTFPKSVSKAIAIGRVHRQAKEAQQDPLNAILNQCKGIYIGSGQITDIDRAISEGFLYGSVVIQNRTERMELIFQNEYLIAKRDGDIIATTPDILTLLEQDTGTPILSETLQYGLKVNLIALPAPSLWTTPEGLALVGPRCFGYEIDYQPFVKIRKSSHSTEMIESREYQMQN